MTVLLNFGFSFLSTAAFAIITNIPRRALFACGLTGAFGWMIFYFSRIVAQQNIGYANFLAALGIGLASIFFSRKMRMPVILFNIPSLVPLVPGGPAYQAVRDLMAQNFNQSLENIAIVLVTSGAIALGFMFSNLAERLLKLTRQNLWHK
ncbi:threonine/serine exporter family protein [Enterococcus sp. CSURQ0835]|uniref:threonine/serine exporter family protein n=1 Tax=Enterococcus sp. CSURQ0835 TaxID=2681394 RepID=UPI00135CEC53|nr:threonine/serine exporter family protein [Enterococcus sp. CSURQ0835]